MTIRQIVKIIATRCHILRRKCTKFDSWYLSVCVSLVQCDTFGTCVMRKRDSDFRLRSERVLLQGGFLDSIRDRNKQLFRFFPFLLFVCYNGSKNVAAKASPPIRSAMSVVGVSPRESLQSEIPPKRRRKSVPTFGAGLRPRVSWA